MRLVEIEELEVGDEIAISCQSYFKYLKILRVPKKTSGTHWRGGPKYTSAKCSTRRSERTYTYTGWNGQQRTRTEKVWEFGPEDHNFINYVNLMDRQILLIKKADESI